MGDKAQGYGLIKRSKLEEQPMVITVGDVTVTILRLGTLTASVAVKAPPELTIQFSDGTLMHETVEQAIQSVLQGRH